MNYRNLLKHILKLLFSRQYIIREMSDCFKVPIHIKFIHCQHLRWLMGQKTPSIFYNIRHILRGVNYAFPSNKIQPNQERPLLNRISFMYNLQILSQKCNIQSIDKKDQLCGLQQFLNKKNKIHCVGFLTCKNRLLVYRLIFIDCDLSSDFIGIIQKMININYCKIYYNN